MTDRPWPVTPGRLMPCPFCAQPPDVIMRYVDTGSGDGRRWFGIECSRHPHVTIVATALGPHGYRQPEDPPDDAWAMRAAVKAWNGRSVPKKGTFPAVDGKLIT